MSRFVDLLSAVVSGKPLSDSDLSGMPEREKGILSECEGTGRSRGFFCDYLTGGKSDALSSENLREKIESLSCDLQDICALEADDLALNAEYVNMKGLILEVMEDFHEQAKNKGVDLVARIDSQPLKVYADPKRVKRILSILLDNAIRFTKATGEIRLLAKGLPQEVIISVLDSGVGINTGLREGVFQRFMKIYAQPECLKGSGVRLNLAQLLVKAHGGRAWFEQNGKHGSNFSFCVPREMLCHYVKPGKIQSLFS